MRVITERFGVPLLYPNVDYFLDRAESGDVFRYVRFNHATFDALNTMKLEHLQKWSTNKEYHRIAKFLRNNYSQYGSWHKGSGLYEDILEYVHFLFDLNKPTLVVGMDTAIGLGTEGMAKKELQEKRTETLLFLKKRNRIDIYHSGLPKHFAIMNEVDYFMSGLVDRGFKILFLGPEYIKDIIEKIDTDITHIEIPYRKANVVFRKTIEDIKQNHLSDKTIIFHSTGHLLSTILINNLMDTNVYTFDVGRGFDWLLDKEHPAIKNHGWVTFHKKRTEVVYKKLINKLRNG